MRKEYECKVCGLKVKRFPSELGKNGVFCSISCSSKYVWSNPEARERAKARMIGNKQGLGYKHTEEARRRISVTHKGKLMHDMYGANNPFYGKHHAEETKKKNSESHKGSIAWNKGMHTMSEESKNKLRLINTGRPSWNKGKHHSEETKRKLSEVRKEKFANDVGYRKMMYEAIFTKENREKFRIRMIGNKQSLGKKHSEESKVRHREARSKIIIPKRDTMIELKIQEYLKALDVDFFTHQYMRQIDHSYQCDILVPAMDLVIECDGDYWHKYPVGNALDHIRTKELLEKGFKVLRLWEHEIEKMGIEEFKKRLSEVEL